MSRDSAPDVCLIAPYPRLGVIHGGASGVASYTANLAHALDDAGARVTVVAPREDGEQHDAYDGGVRVLRAFRPGARALPTAAAAARSTGAPVIHLQHELFLYGGPAAIPGLLTALRNRGRHRHVVTMHQVVDPKDVDRDFVRLHRLAVPRQAARLAIDSVQRCIHSLSDRVIVHEPTFAKHFANAVAVPHGIEAPDLIDRSTAKTHLGLDPDKLVALCFGFVAPYKGLETAIHATRLAGPDAQLVIAGGAHPRLEHKYGYATQLIRDHGDVVRFTGYVNHDDVSRWFRAADVVLLPYPAPHASSGALALALAHETPVLASTAMARTCGVPDTVAFATAANLAGQLRDLVSRTDALQELHNEIKGLREQRTWPSVARRHLDVYAELAA